MNVYTGGVLVLSHCGFSFLEDIIQELESRALKCFVLSSLPLPEHLPQRLDHIRNRVHTLKATASHVLQRADVDGFIADLREQGEAVECCLSVWEGYRHLMAHANQRLGIHDLSVDDVLRLRNKLAVRNRMASTGLSTVRAVKLTPLTLERLKRQDRHFFLKPIHGIASYAAFPLRPETTWASLQAIREGARHDTVYASAFNGELTFMAEDYVHGQEYSFETLIIDGQAFVMAVHEKCEVTQADDTVLEDCCASPPVSLSQAQTAAGIHWVQALAASLGMTWGCFHIEARFDGQRWDLIEVNPRVGGSLISHSVRAMTHTSLLGLWLDLLISARIGDPSAWHTYAAYLRGLAYDRQGVSPSDTGTFFRVYFAHSGVLETVALRPLAVPPVVAHVLLHAGDVVAPQAREVFLGQALWAFNRAEARVKIPFLRALSEEAIDIRYVSAAPATEHVGHRAHPYRPGVSAPLRTTA